MKMLVIFAGVPVTAPDESMFFEELIAQIIFINFISEIFGTVRISFAALRGNICGAVIFIYDIRIEKRVNVDGKPKSMFGKIGSTVHYPVIKAGCIVVLHGKRIVAVVFINEPDLFYLVFVAVQFVENLHQILGDRFVTNQFPGAFRAVKIIMKDAYIA